MRNALERFRMQGQKVQKLDILFEAYNDTVERIKSQRNGFRQLAEKTLYWISHAARQLTIIELQHALAVDLEIDSGNIPREFDDESKPEIDLIVSVCCGLVTTDQDTGNKNSRFIRLVHFTTQEYLSQVRGKWFPEAEKRMADVCTVYLCFDVFESMADLWKSGNYYEFYRMRKPSSLYAYSSLYWGHHARDSNTSSHIMLEFLANGNKVQAAAKAMVNRASGSYKLLDQLLDTEDTLGLTLAAFFGAITLVQKLLDEPTTKLEDRLDTALRSAVFGGCGSLIELLLDKGANPNIKDRRGEPLIISAIRNGHTELVQVLLKHGADPNKKNWYGEPLIILATRDGHTDLIPALLKHGADPNTVDEDGTPLIIYAVDGGHEDLVRALVTYGADPNKKDKRLGNWTALLQAVQKDQLTITELLLENGADYTLQSSRFGETVIDMAIKQGSQRMAQLFLDKIAHPVEKATELKRMVLSSAVTFQKIEFAQMVFEKDPGLDLKGKYGTELLFLAAEDGRRDRQIIELLLEKGASPNLKGSDGTEQPLSEEEGTEREWLAVELDEWLNTA